ncbi:hypothetical protein D4Q52_01560 [Rhodopseudomonas palustris]|uniref:Uncharacterized protein n=1 Tax=Rhodopseudomonas palustris TaxID=1076 RepID=A0A418VR93_RHOPL|nr:hypothetical protein D4Q52_01560 [Rhodopseudomonas palustris]
MQFLNRQPRSSRRRCRPRRQRPRRRLSRPPPRRQRRPRPRRSTSAGPTRTPAMRPLPQRLTLRASYALRRRMPSSRAEHPPMSR